MFRAQGKTIEYALGAFVMVVGTLMFSSSAEAAVGVNQQINFQGKVVNTDGTNVTNGSYSFLLCLYATASPATACTAGANNDAVWRESKSLTVTDGVFQTALGDTTALPGSVDFNTDNIYLGVNFNSNGQMTPLIRFTAVPYAFNADKVHGLTVTDTTGTLTVPNGKTISFADAFSTTGAFPLTLTATGSTTATLPAGTITLADTTTVQTLTNKAVGSTGLVFSGAVTDITTGTGEDLVVVANGAGVVDIQDSVTADSLTIDTAGITISSGALAVNSDSITSDGALVINATSTDIQDAVTVDSLTADAGGISIAAGQSYTGSGAVTLSSGAATTLTLNSGTTGTIAIGDDASAETINIGTGAAVKTLVFGSTDTTSTTTLRSGTGGINLVPESTAEGMVQIGTGGAGTATPDLLALDTKSDAGDPATAVEGTMYYNQNTNKFRCYEGAAWKDCDTGGSGGGTPAGSTTQVQLNDGGAFGADAGLTFDTSTQTLGLSGANAEIDMQSITDEPGASASGRLRLYAKSIAGRMMPKWVGPSGLDVAVQPFLGNNKMARWTPAGNSTTIVADGAAALTATGTATASNVAVTTRHTWMKRLDYLVTTAATTAVAGFRSTANQFAVGGSGTGDGGFFSVFRWGPATGVATATNRAFVGMSTNTAAPTDVQPSTLVNMFGMGWDAADTNIQFLYNDGSGTASKIDLGSSFPVPTADRTKVYDLTIFSPPGSATVYYRITDLATNAEASGSVSTNIPVYTTLLSPRGYISAGGTSSVIGLALMSLYIETDF